MTETDGRRIYAIGDIHGCLDALTEMMGRVHADLAANPHDAPLVVFIGDYLDRGPDSRGVVDLLLTLEAGELPTVFLLGNHDAMLLDYLGDPAHRATHKYHWFDAALGGDKTVASYGVPGADPTKPEAVHAKVAAAVPPKHVDFINRAALHHEVGGYLFVHAGIRPYVPLQDQTREDLIWIRDPVLLDPGPHPHIVVHGHTVVPRVEHHGNRIAIDTGAVFSGVLSCIL
ncbi:MAG: metallophosphoesterase family protein, partial [Pseudomonadota bacterium]